MTNANIAATAAVVGILGLAGVASASPVTYDYTSGEVVITNITVNGQAVLGGTSSPEFGFGSNSTAAIDTVGDTLAFSLLQSSTAFSAPLTGSVVVGTGTNKTTFNLSAATFALSGVQLTQPSGSTLSLTALGGGAYSFAAPVGITVSGSYDLSGVEITKAGVTNPYNSGIVSFKPHNNPFSGSATLFASGDTLQVDGLSLGTWTVDGQSISATGNVIFEGTAVPLPGALWLFGSSLGLFGLGFMRPKRAA